MEGYLKVVNQNIPTDIIAYSDYKIKAIKARQEYANRQGLVDHFVKGYDSSKALSTFDNKAYHHFFIIVDDHRVGCLELKEGRSEVDGTKVGIVTAIYADEKYRTYQNFEKVIYEIQEMYPMRIEVELWYDQPEITFFKKFGFRNLSMRMTLT